MSRIQFRSACRLVAYLLATWPGMALAQSRETLPETIVPTHYDLAIRPDLEALTFTGTNIATIDVRAPTSDVVLNADGLVFDSARLEVGAAGTTRYDQKLGRAIIHFDAPVRAGRHRLTIDYHGVIGRETTGVFAMDYDTAAGRRRTFATNLEPTGARKLFPGWDEPSRKARYTVTVEAPADRMAISNMPIARTVRLSPALNRVTFAESPQMSSYLFFLGIGDWERVARQVDGIDVGVVVRRGDTPRARYALDEASTLLRWYNAYFGVRYPLPKLDLIAAPGQIALGSMENWGAIFYSQDDLLFDPTGSSEADRQNVFTAVAHEMAHQWFGDLVTMSWWNDLWLNEGFARWMQVYVADALHPDWKMGLKAQSIFESGKAEDSLPSTHPIVQEIDTANQAALAFDGITYNKGAAVIAMLAATTGNDAFRAGVRAYMRAHAYGNTVDADFWTALQRVSGKPIRDIERDFTTQPGLPLIRVMPDAAGLHLTTDRYTVAGPAEQTTPQRWRIPLDVTSSNKTTSLLLSGSTTVAATPPTLVNSGQAAYARVLYDPASFMTLMPRVPTLTPVDQIGLAQDALALGRAGYAPGGNFFEVVSRVRPDAVAVVWQRIANLLMTIDQSYGDPGARTVYRKYATGLLRPVLSVLGKTPRTGEAPDVPIARARLTEVLGAFGDRDVLADAKALMASGGGTPGERQTAQVLIAAQADTAEFDALLLSARTTKDPLEKSRLYQALAGVEDEALAERMAAIVITDEVPAGTNTSLIVPLVRAHPTLAWKQIVPHLADPKTGLTPSYRWRIAALGAGLLSDPAMIADVRAYAKREVPADARRPFEGAEAAITVNHRVVTQMLPEIDRWIADRAR